MTGGVLGGMTGGALGGAVGSTASVPSASALTGTVIVRVAGGAEAGSGNTSGAAGFGPDSNSGTMSTTSTSKMLAPTSLCLTRRSMSSSRGALIAARFRH
jgi:hypothetical protein